MACNAIFNIVNIKHWVNFIHLKNLNLNLSPHTSKFLPKQNYPNLYDFEGHLNSSRKFTSFRIGSYFSQKNNQICERNINFVCFSINTAITQVSRSKVINSTLKLTTTSFFVWVSYIPWTLKIFPRAVHRIKITHFSHRNILVKCFNIFTSTLTHSIHSFYTPLQ